MEIIPVLDLLDGVVVRGVAGKRDQYRPIESVLTDSAEPLEVARAIRERFGLSRLYVADLDAILHHTLNEAVYRQLANEGFQILLDADLQQADDAQSLFDAGATDVIAGLETICGPIVLSQLCERYDPRRIVFSLDLSGGNPLGNPAAWNSQDPVSIAADAVAAGIRKMIVLDLTSVGIGDGVPTRELCRALRQRHPELELITGGGVRDVSDLYEIAACGVNGLLVASALHRGNITPQEIAEFNRIGN